MGRKGKDSRRRRWVAKREGQGRAGGEGGCRGKREVEGEWEGGTGHDRERRKEEGCTRIN